MRPSKSIKMYKVKAPGGKIVTHFRKKKPSYAKCGKCGAKLNRSRFTVKELKKLPKTKKRPERPFPNLCPKCMREILKNKVRR